MNAPPAPAAPRLCLVSKNVGGLQSCPRKRARLFCELQSKKQLDVVLLQETHTSDDTAIRRWAAEAASQAWVGQQFWHHGTSASRGVAILVRDTAAITEVRKGFQDTEGRLLRIDFKYAGLAMSVLNVYAPCEPTLRAAFYHTAMPAALIGGGVTLVGGDFNCVLSAQDHTGSNAFSSRLQGRDQLQALMVMEQLEDTWQLPGRAGRPHGRQYSFHTQVAAPGGGTSFTAARLDRWLTPLDLRTWVIDTVIHPNRNGFLPGDHGAVVLTLQPPNQPERGPGVWSLPLSILNDADFKAAAVDCIMAFQHQHAAMGARDRWEGTKTAVADFSHAYCMEQAANRRRPLHALQRICNIALAACAARPGDCAVASAQLREAEARIAQLHMDEALASKQAADVLWQDYGEQGSFWFHKMGRAPNPLDQTLSVMAADGTDLSLTSDDPAMRAAAAERLPAYYEGLFAAVVTCPAAQQVILAATPQRLTEEAVKEAEGPDGDPTLSLECFKAAVKAAPRGKRPGSDGLPYEFYHAFEEEVGPLLLEAFEDAYADTSSLHPLPASQRHGLITRIHKGWGKSRSDCDSYRPITLLNCDYKLAARIIATRLGSPANDILSITQTAFVPGRDITDNVLFHLEEVDWLESSPPAAAGSSSAAEAPRQGCVVFLDFEKAYDRASRSWTSQCLAHYGFGPGLRRWVEVLMAGTTAQVLFNGHRSRSLSVVSGMAQGSPLSPLLYNLQAQPLAAYMQHLQSTGILPAILLPGGLPAPPTHQHADDTTLHLASLSAVPPALEGVALYCSASGGRLNVTKTQGMLLGSHPDVPADDGVDAASGVRFLRPGQFIRHLGVLLARTADKAAAATAMHTQRQGALTAAVRQWSPWGLSHLGRLHVAKQCLASILYYHAQFIRPAPDQLQGLVRIITNFIARPTPGSAVDDGRACISHPKLAVSSLPREEGGLGVVDVKVQLDALQAKHIARLIHPRRHAWKVLMAAAIRRASPAHLGLALPFHVAARIPQRAALRAGHTAMPTRIADCLQAMRRLSPHRAAAPSDMPHHEVLLEPLFDNACIRHPTCHSILTRANAPAALTLILQQPPGGINRLRDLRTALHNVQPTAAHVSILDMLPPSWREAVCRADEPLAGWYCNATATLVASSADVTNTTTTFKSVLNDGRLSKQHLPAPPPLAALQATAWTPCCVVPVPRSAALMTNAERQAIQVQLDHGVPRRSIVQPQDWYLAGAWDSLDVSPEGWCLGANHWMTDFNVHDAALRARRLRYLRLTPGHEAGRPVFPKAWQAAGGGGGMAAVELRWVAGQTAATGSTTAHDSAAGPSDPAAALAARIRRQYQEVQPVAWQRSSYRFDGPPAAALDDMPAQSHEPQQPQPDGIGRRVRARHDHDAAIADDQGAGGQAGPAAVMALTMPDHVDLAAPRPGQAGPSPARQAWLRLAHRMLPREARALAWRIMHLSLYSGVFYAHVTGQGAHTAACTSAACQHVHVLESTQHIFLDCPDVAATAGWLIRLWSAIGTLGEAAPPRTADVLLADDQRIWQPAGGGVRQQLWTALRLCWLAAVWAARCRRQSDPERFPVSAAGVVAATVAGVQRMIRRDFCRTMGDVRTMTATPAEWFRGAGEVKLTRAMFLERWSCNGVLCEVGPPGPGGGLQMRLSATHPVALAVDEQLLALGSASGLTDHGHQGLDGQQQPMQAGAQPMET